jgi:hypothetical protein
LKVRRRERVRTSVEEIQIFLKTLESDFIAALKFAVLARLFLNGIVSEMNVLVAEIFERKLKAGCSHVSSGIEICRNVRRCSHEDEASDVKLASMEQIG